jgi:hypothetical protein
MGTRRLWSLVLFFTAAAGLVGGHLLNYVWLVPQTRARHAILAITGHSYLPDGLVIGLAAALLAGTGTAVLGAISPDRRPSLRDAALCLSGLQMAGFLLLEVVERLLGGAPLSDLAGPVLALGIPLQVALALLGASVLVLIARTARMAMARLSRGPRPIVVRRIRQPFPPARSPARADVRGGLAIRAPPHLLATA